MTIKSSIRGLAAAMGVHVTRMSQNPEHTLLGLGRTPFDVIFDVGANQGQWARSVRGRFPHAKIICFEPTPHAFKALDAWAKADGNAVAIQSALGDEPGSVEMNVHPEHTQSSSLLTTTEHSHRLYPVTEKQERVDVTVERLDDVISRHPDWLAPHVLLKLDVQGFEGAVLRGAPQLLSRIGACILEVCLDQLYVGQSTFEELCVLTRSAGLRYAGNIAQAYGEDGHVIYLDALFVR